MSKKRHQQQSSPGARALTAFLAKHGITLQRAAAALGGVSSVSVHEWAQGRKRPRQHYREAIELWTNGVIPAESWASAEERKLPGKVTPFEPTGTDG